MNRMRQLELDLDDPPTWYPSPLPIDTGWSCAHGPDATLVWTHEDGTKLEERGSVLFGSYEVRVNGGEWKPAKSFGDAIEAVGG